MSSAYFRIGDVLCQSCRYEEAIEAWEEFMKKQKELFNDDYKTETYRHAYFYVQKLKAYLEESKRNFINPFLIVPLPELETYNFADVRYAKWFISRLPAPKSEVLKNKISTATKVEIYEVITQLKDIAVPVIKDAFVQVLDVIATKLIYKEHDKNATKKLLEALTISEADNYGHLMKPETLVFKFYHQDELLAEIQFLNKHLIRWENQWKNDAPIKSPEALQEWLKSRNIEIKENNGKIEYM